MLFLKEFLRKTFDIREGEYQRVLLMQLNIFLIVFVLLIIKPVVNAQFLSVIGVDELPFVFVLVAIAAMAVSTIYSRSLNKRSIRRMTSITLGISIMGLISMAVLIHFHVAERLVLYLLYIGVAIFGVLTTSQFWIMANLAFDAREAKRIFGFLGAGPIAGGVAGGYATSLMAPHFSASTLLIIAAAMLAICIPLNTKIWRKHIKPLNTFQKQKRLTGFGDHPLNLIRKSKHLTFLALLVGLGVVVTKLVDFQFSSVASMAYPDPEELTSFLAFWFSTFNVVSLLIQLFLTRRIVGTYGVGTSLYALPGGVLAGSVLLFFAPVLWAGVITKLWEVSVKQSVNKAATELLALPIPMSIKSQTKGFIDVFVDMAATGVGGFLLIIVVNGMNFSIRAVSVLTIAILGVWFWVALKVRKEYVNSFKSKLSQADKKANRKLPNLSEESVISGLKRTLENGTERQILFVLQKVQEIPDKRLFEDVTRFLTHESAAVRAQALDCLYYLNQTVDALILDNLMNNPTHEVRYKAFSQLLRQTKDDRMTLIHKYLLHENPQISGAALLAVSEEARNNPEMKRILKLEQRMQEKLEYARLTENREEQKLFRLIVLRAAGKANIPTFYPMIELALDDQNMEVVLTAISAAGGTMSEQFIPVLCEKLLQKDTRVTAQNALLNYGKGIIPKLAELAKDPNTNPQIIGQIPGVIERIDSQQAIDCLMSFLDIPDVNLRLESLRALNAAQKEFPHLKIQKKQIIERILEETTQYREITGILYQQAEKMKEEERDEVNEARQVLLSLLERRTDGTLERIFRLLGLRYPPDDVISAYEGIKSVNPSVRSNSVEFLDNLLEPGLKRQLLPIAETAISERISSDVIGAMNIKKLGEIQCLELLLKGRDPKLKSAVFRLIEAINDQKYIALVRPFVNSPVSKVSEQAIRISKQFDRHT